jgi:peptidoglycan hydrolase-like protein with peptidoglycan-binding domain
VQTFDQTIQQGASGSEITVIQERLRQLGYFNQSPTGNFGSVTRNAVIQFQRQNGLNPDGVIGSQTINLLFSASARPTQFLSNGIPATTSIEGDRNQLVTSRRINELRRGDRGPQVRLLQERLTDKGFYPGLIDGIYGTQTQSAVKQFQQENNFFADGVASSATLTALGIKTDAATGSYIVVVPLRDQNTLIQVQQYIPNAIAADSRQGKYVNAGDFPSRAVAESRSNRLRSLGFDARVAYFR